MSDDSSRKILAGARLRRLRRELALSQSAMAMELGISVSYLNLMERNYHGAYGGVTGIGKKSEGRVQHCCTRPLLVGTVTSNLYLVTYRAGAAW
ncbi:helix-turn-helix domain-containing protein [Candidatus Gracilibacteria bacterium]|nr:helix-turn-helix domain-containing protein [Candidatus Gracilibacteria bacterium]